MLHWLLLNVDFREALQLAFADYDREVQTEKAVVVD